MLMVFVYLKIRRNDLKVNKIVYFRLFIENIFYRMKLLTEKFASRMLANLAKQHGGIKKRINGGMRDGVSSWYRDRAVDLSTITDDMLAEPFQFEVPEPKFRHEMNKTFYIEPDGTEREVSPKEEEEIRWEAREQSLKHERTLNADQLYNMVLFNDGWAVALKPYSYHKEHGTQEPNEKPSKEYSKYGSGIGDTGDHNRKPSPWVTDGGKVQGQTYNPYSVSDDSAESYHIRRVIANLQGEAEEYAKDAENSLKKAEQATNPMDRLVHQNRARAQKETEETST